MVSDLRIPPLSGCVLEQGVRGVGELSLTLHILSDYRGNVIANNRL